MEHTGWLLDLFADPQGGVILWLLGDDGKRYRLLQRFPITFYAAGPALRLRALWRFLENQPIPVTLSRTQRRDLFQPQPLTVLAIRVERSALQPRLFQQLVQKFPDLTYYDADIQLTLRYAAIYHVFPLARCQVSIDDAGEVEQISPLDSPWDLDPPPPPLRTLSIEPDSDPAHAAPTHLSLHFERYSYRLSLKPVRPLLIGLRSILNRHDPDLLLTSWGDTWLMPHLLDLCRKADLPLPFNREPNLAPAHRPERTYFSYGQVVYQGRQVHLFGRWHIDRYNAMLFHDYGMHGIYELSRVTSLPIQTSARVSPGSGISAMQMLTALRQDILVPWHKQQAERPKTILDLMRADQGGLVYQPTIGLHYDVAEIDFISMYPSIMVHFNISPETVGSSQAIADAAPELGPPGDPQPQGLVPQTLAPLLEKRLELKTTLSTLPTWHPQRKIYQARASAHKWLFSPKGVGIFYARQPSQPFLKPLIVARGWEDESIRRLENYNTRNLPEVLGLGTAIDFQNLMKPDRRQARIFELKRYFRRAIGDDPAFKVKTPASDELSAGITTVEAANAFLRETYLSEHEQALREEAATLGWTIGEKALQAEFQRFGANAAVTRLR